MFTPFETPLDHLQAHELDQLRETKEGWYVEYKRDLPNASSIAKSISAFANTYGGWLFIGVDEASKSNSVAGSFPGLSSSDANAALQSIRHAVGDHMNPPAHFDARAIFGNEGASFPADRAIICVRVPQSLVAPHVHRSGQIYRRVGEGSEPRPENDRHLLDQLFRRADELKRSYSDWHDRDPEFSKSEENLPYLRLMFMVDPWEQESPWLDIDTAELSSFLNESPPLLSRIPFDTVHTSGHGFLARQINTNDPHNLGLTWHIRQSLISDVIVPLRFFDGEENSVDSFLNGYETKYRFKKILSDRNYRSPRLVDLNMIYNLLVSIVETQRRLLNRAGWTKEYYVKVRLINAWRTVPFLDIPEILDEFDAHGIPMCLDSTVTSPLGRDPDSFAELPKFDATDEAAAIIWQAMFIFSFVAQPWGIPTFVSTDKAEIFLKSLTAAGRRAMSVQDNG